MLKIVYKKTFDGISNKRPFNLVNHNILKNNNYAVELYEDDKIVNLNIPHYPIYCQCSPVQWNQILKKIQELGLLQKKTKEGKERGQSLKTLYV